MADSYESVMNFGISAHYSPNVGEGEFCELRHIGVLRSSHKASEDGIMLVVERDALPGRQEYG
jgi:hypothetical protein